MASVVFPSPHVAPSPERPSAVVVKLSLRGETYRVPFETQELTWRALEAKVHDCYDDASRPALWALLYRDDEDDLVTVGNDRELREAIRVFAELKGEPATVTARGEYQLHVHFHVVAKLSLKEQLAPVLHAVTEISEKMARVAADTRESLRKSSYVERGRESLYHSAANTRQALSSAGRGLSQRVRRASTVVVDEISVIPRRLRTRSRFSSQDMRENDTSPQTLMATDAARDREDDEDSSPTEMDVAELLAQARAEEEAAERVAVEARQNDEEHDSTADEGSQLPQSESTPVTSAAVVAAEPEVADEVGHASDADTASTASEDTHDEWDIVRSSSSPATRPLSPFFEVEADDQEEVSFTRWETQLTTIRDIMPEIDLGVCVDMLEKHNGNLEAALVELTEL